MATHFKREEMIMIFNNIAKRKGVPLIPINSKLSFDQLADRLEKLQRPSAVKQTSSTRRNWLLRLLHTRET